MSPGAAEACVTAGRTGPPERLSAVWVRGRLRAGTADGWSR
jgi:hypothetical protein